jgi:Histidine kinase-, DNA gyrase B-, and HSP90-like ATPase/FHA domain
MLEHQHKPGTTTTVALSMTHPGRIKLRVHSGYRINQTAEVPNQGIIIGSSDSAGFFLDDPLVSPEHAGLFPNKNRWVLHDLASENGTFLNGRLIKQSTVNPGEIIRVGNRELSIEFMPSADESGWVKRSGEWVQIPRIIAHELRNYLGFLDKGVEQLRQDPELEQRFNSEFQVMQVAKDKIDDLVQHLRVGCIPPRFKNENLSDIIWEQSALLASLAESRSVRLLVTSCPDTLPIRADRDQIGRCFLNVFKNALEACSEGDEIRVSASLKDQTALVVVQDTGMGMDANTVESMWSPLFTTKKDGNGLGAFIARTILMRHNGTVSVTSVVKSGTTLEIRLPVIP